MSRSYRKNLVQTQGYGTSWRRFAKREANKKVRRSADVPDGRSYRKYYNSWNICDWRSEYDPEPRCYSWGGKIHYFEPDPIWQWKCK